MTIYRRKRRVFTWATFLWLLGSPVVAAGDCTSLAEEGDCDFYQCLDAQLGGCGWEGYPLGFGHKYCKRFLDDRGNFDLEVCELRSVC